MFRNRLMCGLQQPNNLYNQFGVEVHERWNLFKGILLGRPI